MNLRIDRKAKASLMSAARVSGRTLTGFVLDSAMATAADVLASRKAFVLNAKDWRKFNDLLDAPPRDVPALKRLLRKESVFQAR